MPKPDAVKELEEKIEAIQPDLTGTQIRDTLKGNDQTELEALKMKIAADYEKIKTVLGEYEKLSDIKKEQFEKEILEKLEGLVLISGSIELALENQSGGGQVENLDLLLGLIVTAQDLEQQKSQGMGITVVMEIAELKGAVPECIRWKLSSCGWIKRTDGNAGKKKFKINNGQCKTYTKDCFVGKKASSLPEADHCSIDHLYTVVLSAFCSAHFFS